MAKSSHSPVEIRLKDLLELKQQAESLSMPQTSKNVYTGFGNTKSPFRSRGLDFQEVRVYQPGDDIRQIDWRVTAKYGKPFTKLYTEDKERCLFFVCDLRQGMHFASHGDFKSVVAGRMTAFLAFSAAHRKDKIGAIVMTDNGFVMLTPSKDEDALTSLLQMLSAPEEMPLTSGTMVDALKRLLVLIPSGSYLFIFSDFYDWDESMREVLSHFSIKHTLLLCPIYDILETQLPKGKFAFSDGKVNLAFNTDKLWFQHQFEKVWAQRFHMLQTVASKQDWGLVPIRTDSDYLNILTALCLKEGV